MRPVRVPEVFVMAGLVPAIHVLLAYYKCKDVDARHKAGHDVERFFVT
jgi:hypothetical protein